MKVDAQNLKNAHKQKWELQEELRTKSKDLGEDKNETVYVKMIDKILKTSPNREKNKLRLLFDQMRPRKHIFEPQSAESLVFDTFLTPRSIKPQQIKVKEEARLKLPLTDFQRSLNS